MGPELSSHYARTWKILIDGWGAVCVKKKIRSDLDIYEFASNTTLLTFAMKLLTCCGDENSSKLRKQLVFYLFGDTVIMQR